MTERESYTDVLCVIRAVTAKAYRIETGVGDFHWVPRSVCMNGHKEYAVSDTPTLKIADWFVEKNEIAA